MTALPRCLRFLSLAGLFLGLLPGARAQFTLSSGADFSEGKYGEAEKTKVFSVPCNLEDVVGRWTFKFSIPYVHLSGPGSVLPGLGRVKTVVAPPQHDVSGQGDATVSASYLYYQRADGLLTLDGGAEIKFGTADHAKGLGTGKADFGVHLDAYRTWDKLTGLATLGYHVLGKPSDSDLRNNIYATLGWSFQASPSTSCGLLYSANEKTSASSSAQAEAIAFATHKFGVHWTSQVYVLTGTTSSSPAVGVGLVLGHPF